jgi:hypothetical protein
LGRGVGAIASPLQTPLLTNLQTRKTQGVTLKIPPIAPIFALLEDRSQGTASAGSELSGSHSPCDLRAMAFQFVSGLRDAALAPSTTSAAPAPASSPGTGLDFSVASFLVHLGNARSLGEEALSDLSTILDRDGFVDVRDLPLNAAELVDLGVKRGHAAAIVAVLKGTPYKLPRS